MFEQESGANHRTDVVIPAAPIDGSPADKLWAKAKAILAPDLNRPDCPHTVESVEEALAAREMAYIFDGSGALVYEILNLPRFRVLNVVSAGGDFDLGRLTNALAIARDTSGCRYVAFPDRLGSGRGGALANLGYRAGWTVMLAPSETAGTSGHGG